MSARKSWMAELPPSDASPGNSRDGRDSRSKPLARSAATPYSALPKGRTGVNAGKQPAAVTDRLKAASGSGLTSERMRRQMADRLRQAGIRDEPVLHAMTLVPRHTFVDEGFASRAYEDSALPIGHGQTISQPFIVARMIELLRAGSKPAKVLEVGTGCGYQAAVLAHVAGEVYSIERIRALHDRARANLRPLRLPNLRLVYGDGMAGIAAAAPFDAIVVAAAAERVPQDLLEQLAIGGRMILPVGQKEQSLRLVTRTAAASWSDKLLEPVMFVPLRPGLA